MGCGDGVLWFVERNGGADTLASGTIANGGASGAQSLTGLVVSAGERINFIVDDNGGWACDSTLLTATIHASTAQSPPTVTVNNVAPTIMNVSLDQTVIDENGSVTLAGSVTDPGTLDEHVVTVNWGDLASPETFAR